MEEWEVVPRVAAATAMKAQEQGVARLTRSAGELRDAAAARIRQAREAARQLMEGGLIPPVPEE
jgi:malate dehydrogenase (oxaloacetate-decarboxylating)